MAEWTKVKLLKHTEGYAYHDKYGAIDCAPSDIYLTDNTTGREYGVGELFLKTADKFVRLNKQNKIDFENLFKTKIYIWTEDYRRRYMYSGNNPTSDEMVQSINLSQIRIEYRGFGIEINSDDKSALDTEVWISPNFTGNLRAVEFYRLKEGMRVYYRGAGTCTVEKIYGLNKENLICHIKPLSGGASIDVKSNDGNIYYLPYEEPEHYLKRFNEFINENALRPRVDWYFSHGYRADGYGYQSKRSGERAFNVYWLPVEDVARYTVSLYRLYKDGNSGRGNVLYKLKDYIVDRNDCMLTVDKLFGDGHIIKVSAENRNGEIIAMSRGIKNDEPEWWDYE